MLATSGNSKFSTHIQKIVSSSRSGVPSMTHNHQATCTMGIDYMIKLHANMTDIVVYYIW